MTKTKTKTKIQIGEHITLTKRESGIWYVTHPNKDGRRIAYSTGIKGTTPDVKRWVKEAKIQDIVEVGMRAALSSKVINRITNRDKSWFELLEEFRSHMKMRGYSYSTRRDLLNHNRRFLREFVPSLKVNEVEEEHAFRYLNYHLTCNLSTRETIHNSMRTFWKFLVSMGYAERNVIANTRIRHDILPHLKKEARKKKAFSRDDFDALMDHLDEVASSIRQNERPDFIGAGGRGHYRLSTGPGGKLARLRNVKFFRSAANFAYGIGLRRCDVCLLEWDAFSDDGWMIIHTKKTNTRIAIPYMPNTINEFLSTVEGDPEPIRKGLEDSAWYIRQGINLVDDDDLDPTYVYPRYRKNPHSAVISGNFTSEVSKAGLPKGLTFHSLRRARIREWDDLGIRLEHIGKFVGHSSEATTEIYLHD